MRANLSRLLVIGHFVCSRLFDLHEDDDNHHHHHPNDNLLLAREENTMKGITTLEKKTTK